MTNRSAPPNPLRCFAVTAPGLEAITAAELVSLGVPRRAMAVEMGGVAWTGDQGMLQAANLHLRSASRVLVRVAEFRATAFWELERRARPLPWEGWIGEGAAIQVRATCRKSKLYHSDAVAERVAEAIARRVRGATVVRAAGDDDEHEAEDEGASQLVVARLARDQLLLSVDASGELLHRRGYRQAVAKAPLRETIAAAMLLAVGWSGGEALLDPMCGSGTLAIEAALLARRIAPGLARAERGAFAFLRWPMVDRGRWSALVAEAQGAVRPRAEVPIVAADRDAGAVEATRSNAERAGVLHDLTVERRPVSATTPPADRGWLVANPPYGVRVGEEAAVRDLWARVGQLAREVLPGWGVALLSPHAALDGATGLALEERFRTQNGGIAVRLMAARAAGGSPV
ncbi:MAG TPA: class I SAM-dependent RNA methyltransferase [Gemmatimonadaceae bacterium]|nr:class I SAM-dependent RNA methyltransferase [Gemmatimonadaceae bacterium]